ncbi:hypothetical protein Q5741_10360 [Paenibacillus sp. JX-17]|uniref:Selenocysteine lyase n=1 Tax=Paenibacillus lacisoli TaxID=3064525 RepID=A0ABT9CC39_9BACL|nr:hypothetical protein [Paenibacillus sp. JX-17]MDO7906827.1 hypothetical protein [Paenibacillus sp. JX-17]
MNETTWFDIFVNIFLSTFLVFIPFAGILLYMYFYPAESMMWGKRGMFASEPELSDEAIRRTKKRGFIGLIVTGILYVLFIFLELIR